MKNGLSSVDLRVISHELSSVMVGARVDKVYQLKDKTLVFKLYGKSRQEFVAAANYVCLTKYKRPAPKNPSGFSMQLRKHLRGKIIQSVKQYMFERILEIKFETHTLYIELFSFGNMILCDLEDKILGLNHWQKWRDRVLGVGQTYTLPPSAINPYDLDFNGFGRNFIESGENISRFLATKLSFGGYWAKIICEVAGVDAKSMEPDLNKCWISLKNFLEKMDSDAYPLVSDEDILPFGGEKASYNEALDNFFSGLEGDKEIEEVQALDDSLTKKYVDRLEKQKEGLELAEKLSVDKKVMGDLIYQNMTALNSVFQRIRENKKRNMSDKEILEKLGEFTFIKDFKGFEIVCEF